MQEVILGRQGGANSDEDVDQFAEGVVEKVTPEGMFFTIPEWDDGTHLFGPAPWPRAQVEPTDLGTHGHSNAGSTSLGSHDHVATEPSKGARCVVLFLGAGVDRPWVLGVW